MLLSTGIRPKRISAESMERIDKAPAEAAELALRAHRIDTANLWYHSLYGHTGIRPKRISAESRVAIAAKGWWLNS